MKTYFGRAVDAINVNILWTGSTGRVKVGRIGVNGPYRILADNEAVLETMSPLEVEMYLASMSTDLVPDEVRDFAETVLRHVPSAPQF